MGTPANLSDRARFPEWMRRAIPAPGRQREVDALLDGLKLNTVCSRAQCPNRCECFSRGTATFMILGSRCTRNCRFCAVEHGNAGPPNRAEPAAVAEAAEKLGLSHVVVTSVTRDDLPNGGAEQFAQTIRHIRRRLSAATVEVLTPDFLGSEAAIDIVLQGSPDVFNHNIETVERLYPTARPQASYARSLEVLARVGRAGRQGLLTKSGLMVGLGETDDEVLGVLRDLRTAGVGLLTIGQYLSPSPEHLPVAEYIRPERFDAWKRAAAEMGFSAAAAGPYVRSSYQAERLLLAARS